MTRKEILDAALKCVNGERDQTYGSPEDNFNTIADLWNAYMDVVSHKVPDDEEWYLEAKDVAAMLALLKIARIASGQAKDDNWVDLAGYAACGGEVQSKRNDNEKYKEENDRLREDLAIAKKQLEVKELQEQLCGINLEEQSHKIYNDEIASNIKPPEPVYCCCASNDAETIKKLEEQLKDANEKIGDLLNLQFNSGIHTNPEESIN